MVQLHVRLLRILRNISAGNRRGDPGGCVSEDARGPGKRSQQGPTTRSGKDAVRIQYVLGLHLDVPVSARLVQQHTGRGYALSETYQWTVALPVCAEPGLELGYSFCRAALDPRQVHAGSPQSRLRNGVVRSLARFVFTDHAGRVGYAEIRFVRSRNRRRL